MKNFRSFLDFNPIQVNDFDTIQHLTYDVRAIHNYLSSCLQTTDHYEITQLCPLVENIVSLIRTYIHDNENQENPTHPVEDN